MVVAIATATARSANAGEPMHWLDDVRHDAAADRVREAQATLSAHETEEVDFSDRLAALQVRFVIDRWVASGGVPSAQRDSRPALEPEEDWHVALARARTALIAGHYAHAGEQLWTLRASAPDASWASAAVQLAQLARDVGETHGSHVVVPEVPRDAARDAALDEPAAPAPRRHWYGWETLMSDGISLVTSPVLVGIGGYFLATPIVHCAHGRPLVGLTSFGVRVLAPLTLIVLTQSDKQSGDGGAMVLLGGVVGVASAIVIDAVFLAYEPARKERAPTTSAARAASIVPLLAPRSEGGVDVGVGGRF